MAGGWKKKGSNYKNYLSIVRIGFVCRAAASRRKEKREILSYNNKNNKNSGRSLHTHGISLHEHVGHKMDP